MLSISEGSKTLPPLSKAREAGEIVAPFRGGSVEGLDGCVLSGGAALIRDPGLESAERRKGARAASEKARQLLEERRQAQKALKVQPRIRKSVRRKTGAG